MDWWYGVKDMRRHGHGGMEGRKVTNVSLLVGAALRQHGASGGGGLELCLDVLQLLASTTT